MATTPTNSGQRASLRVAGLASSAALGGLLLLLLELIAPAQAAADVLTETATVTLSSTSSTQSVLLDQFDPAAGVLNQVTITVGVDASANVEVTNLTPAAKATTVTLEVTASAAGPGGSGVTATAIDTASSNLAPNASFAFGVDATADEDQVVTDPAVLAGFVGAGTVSFNLTGLVGADVEGPSTWRGRGAMRATATVTIAYDFTPNAPPIAVADAATVVEDDSATAIPVLANDTDVDGGPISIASVTQPANGTVVITGGGTGLAYQPNLNYCNDPPGTTLDTFTYTLTPGTSTATVTVTVTCVDDAPTAVDDTQTVAEDSTATTIDVLANDTDPEADTFIVGAVTQPANGTVVITNGGADLTYQPNLNFCGSDTFTYTLEPGGDTATVSVTVTCVDDPPVAVDDSATVAEDATPTVVDVLANDTDIDGGPISIASVTQPANGTVVITNGGADLTYQPNLNFCGSDTFTYTLEPGGDTATVSVTVTCVDDPPVAVDDSATVAEDATPTVVDVLANDTDIDGGPISIASVTQPTNGTVVITNGGADLTYQPNLNFCGSDTFTYTLEPGGDTATASVTVTCVDDPPVAVDDSATVAEDATPTVVDVLANDTDIDGGPISIASVIQPTNGTVVITNGGADLTYQPNMNVCSTTPDPFTYTLDPGGSTATVSVTVTCVDDPPVAVDDATTVAEDDPATAVDVLANDTDVDAGPRSIDTVTQPANGAVVITGSGTGVTYQPNLNYCNSQTGQSPDTFTYTLAPGGDTATVSVTVTCVDDPPVAVNDAATVVEDAPATTVDVLANDTDVDAGPMTVVAVTQPANGSVVITNGGDDLTYEPDPDYCNTPPGTTLDTFSYTLNGGSSATVTVTVTCVVEDPIAVDDTATVAEDSAATTIDVLANDDDPDSAGMTIDTVTQPANGTVAITNGSDDLTYQPDPNYCNTQTGGSPDTFTYTLAPGGDSATVSVTVTCVDDPPAAVDDAATVLEDAGATPVDVLANDTDPDAGPISIDAVTQPVNGTVVITGGGAGLTYQPNPNYCNSPPGPPAVPLDAFTYTLTPGTSTAAVLVTVTCVNDAPTITLSGSTPTFTEGGPAVTVDDGLTVTDVDDTSLVSGTVSITAGAVTGDTLTFIPAGGIIDSNPAPGVLDLTGTTTIANWQTVLRSVQFSTASDNPTAATRTVSFTVNDGDAPSNTAAKPVTVVPVNDAPVLTQPDTAALVYTEGNPATIIAPNITATDVDSTTLVAATIDIGAGYANGQDVLSLGTNPQNGITATFDPAAGTLTLTGTSTVANYQTALRDVRYANTSQDPTAATRTIAFQVDDGPGPNDLSNVVTRSVTVTAVNDPPVAGDDSFIDANGALANTRLAVGTTTTGPHLAVPGTVLSNDTDVDTATGLSAGPATISSANCAGCSNVTLNTNGSFTYDPPADFTGTDTFTYTVNDNDPETPANQTDTATVTIEVFGPVVWYVDVDAAAPPAGQGGRSHSPFQSLVPLTTGGTADGLDGDGDIIFLGVDSAAPIAAYDGGIVLETNQRLLGEPFGLTVDPGGAAAGTPPSTILVAASANPDPATNPNVRNSAAGGVGITLANGVDIQRVNAGITGTGSSTAGVSGTAVTTATIGPNQLVQGNTTGVTLSGAAGGDITVAATIGGNTATAVNVANRTSGTVTFTGDISGSAGNAAIMLTNNTGATVAFTGPINLAGSGAAISKFSASGGGTITASNAANQITGFAGTGINLSGVSIGTVGVTFNAVTSAASAVNGVLLTNVAGPGAFTVGGGAIIATTRGLDVDDNSGNVTIGATLATSGAAARSVEVTNRDGGTVDLNGLVTDTSQGINLTTNGTGLVRFDGGITASTGANTAFNATGGGIIAATQNNTTILNTLITTTGTALNVANTTIHADDLTFRSISANGAPNGIVLNNTGGGGNLAVTGAGSTTQGGDNSGGTIQATTGHGIALTNTTGPTFRNMRLLNTGDSGVNGTQVNGFSFTDGTITGAGDASDENSITFDDSLTTTPNLTGAVTITNNVISQTEAEGIDILNFAGTISNANVSGNALSDTGDVATPGSAVSIIASGTPTTAGNITRATVANNTIIDFRAGVGVQVRAGNVNAGGPAGNAGLAGSATDVIAVTGNLMNGGTGGIGNQPDRFFTGGAAGIGQGNFNISNNGTATNRIRNIDCIAIEVQADGPATMTSTVQNNFINPNSAVGCAGIAVGTDDPSNLGAGTHTTLISGNNVMGTDGPGIFPIVRDSGSTMTARVINNVVAAPIATNAARAGIRVDSGSAEGDTTMCLEISGNTTAGSTNTDTGTTSPGINLRKQGTDPAINTFGIEGLAPSPTGTPNVENHVNGLNTSTTGTFGVGGTALLSAQTGFTSCIAP